MSSDDAGSRPATGAIGAIDLPGPAEPAPDAAIEVAGLSKFYPIFERPSHRLLRASNIELQLIPRRSPPWPESYAG